MATILQDKWGYFWRVDGQAATSLSDDQGTVPLSTLASPVAIIKDGQPTGDGDKLATRIALHMATTGKW